MSPLAATRRRQGESPDIFLALQEKLEPVFECRGVAFQTGVLFDEVGNRLPGLVAFEQHDAGLISLFNGYGDHDEQLLVLRCPRSLSGVNLIGSGHRARPRSDELSLDHTLRAADYWAPHAHSVGGEFMATCAFCKYVSLS